MRVEILEFVEGARKAKGVVVIIDVFRAFTVACYAFDAGAVRIIATSEVSNALQLKFPLFYIHPIEASLETAEYSPKTFSRFRTFNY